MRSQGISQFYLHTLRTSANGMNHTCLGIVIVVVLSLCRAVGFRGTSDTVIAVQRPA